MTTTLSLLRISDEFAAPRSEPGEDEDVVLTVWGPIAADVLAQRRFRRETNDVTANVLGADNRLVGRAVPCPDAIVPPRPWRT